MVLLTFCIVIVPAEAATDLKITPTNLNALQTEGTWKSYNSGELLVSQSTKNLYVPYQKSIWVSAPVYAYGLQAADYEGKRYGECVSLVKTLSKSTTPASSWKRGQKVSSGGVKPGTVIATFSGSHYNSGHAAIFRGYNVKNGKIVGIKVWDQNWVGYPTYVGNGMGLIGTHSITSFSNYYVVQV